ncbi:hypothetical protein ACFQHO_53015 [Actinomadura yumaensis]|uniref:hypothetical protein n=1 Tax=Actinomadura yumaensis TaxID=111807 RepID=UPI003609A0EF
MTITPGHQGYRLTVERGGLPPDIESKVNRRAAWNPDAHPRDRKGRFIETGAIVKIWGGGSATVEGQDSWGRIVVKRDDGTRVAVNRQYLIVTARPGGKPPTDRPDDRPSSMPKPRAPRAPGRGRAQPPEPEVFDPADDDAHPDHVRVEDLKPGDLVHVRGIDYSGRATSWTGRVDAVEARDMNHRGKTPMPMVAVNIDTTPTGRTAHRFQTVYVPRGGTVERVTDYDMQLARERRDAGEVGYYQPAGDSAREEIAAQLDDLDPPDVLSQPERDAVVQAAAGLAEVLRHGDADDVRDADNTLRGAVAGVVDGHADGPTERAVGRFTDELQMIRDRVYDSHQRDYGDQWAGRDNDSREPQPNPAPDTSGREAAAYTSGLRALRFPSGGERSADELRAAAYGLADAIDRGYQPRIDRENQRFDAALTEYRRVVDGDPPRMRFADAVDAQRRNALDAHGRDQESADVVPDDADRDADTPDADSPGGLEEGRLSFAEARAGDRVTFTIPASLLPDGDDATRRNRRGRSGPDVAEDQGGLFDAAEPEAPSGGLPDDEELVTVRAVLDQQPTEDFFGDAEVVVRPGLEWETADGQRGALIPADGKPMLMKLPADLEVRRSSNARDDERARARQAMSRQERTLEGEQGAAILRPDEAGTADLLDSEDGASIQPAPSRSRPRLRLRPGDTGGREPERVESPPDAERGVGARGPDAPDAGVPDSGGPGPSPEGGEAPSEEAPARDNPALPRVPTESYELGEEWEDADAYTAQPGDLLWIRVQAVRGDFGGALDDAPENAWVAVTGHVRSVDGRGSGWLDFELGDAEWHTADGRTGPLRGVTRPDGRVDSRLRLNEARPVRLRRLPAEPVDLPEEGLELRPSENGPEGVYEVSRGGQALGQIRDMGLGLWRFRVPGQRPGPENDRGDWRDAAVSLSDAARPGEDLPDPDTGPGPGDGAPSAPPVPDASPEPAAETVPEPAPESAPGTASGRPRRDRRARLEAGRAALREAGERLDAAAQAGNRGDGNSGGRGGGGSPAPDGFEEAAFDGLHVGDRIRLPTADGQYGDVVRVISGPARNPYGLPEIRVRHADGDVERWTHPNGPDGTVWRATSPDPRHADDPRLAEPRERVRPADLERGDVLIIPTRRDGGQEAEEAAEILEVTRNDRLGDVHVTLRFLGGETRKRRYDAPTRAGTRQRHETVAEPTVERVARRRDQAEADTPPTPPEQVPAGDLSPGDRISIDGPVAGEVDQVEHAGDYVFTTVRDDDDRRILVASSPKPTRHGRRRPRAGRWTPRPPETCAPAR